MYQYYLVFGSTKIFLFKSQFQFLTEEASLHHYEKGLAKGLLSFNRARIDQVWSELALWGLIGRICPIELVRILCSFGCDLVVFHKGISQNLEKSFHPVTYFIPVSVVEQQMIHHFYHSPLEPDSPEDISLFLQLDDRLLIGNFYCTSDSDADSQFPLLCKLLERDMCLPQNVVNHSMILFFENGYELSAQLEDATVILAVLNKTSGIIRGCYEEATLEFLGLLSDGLCSRTSA